MRSHRRRTPVEHVLIAGAVEDLPSIERALALLPPDTYGQVFVEAPAGFELPPLARPARITVCRLEAGESTSPLTAAILGWTAEWMPEEPDAGREITVWIGAHASARVDAQCLVLGDLVERI